MVLTVDTNVDSLINSGCTESVDDDDCSLRGTIALANADSSNGYHIDIPNGLYLLDLNSGNPTEDANASGDLDILNPTVELHGQSMLLTIIDGNLTDRVIDYRDEYGVLTIGALTIRNGSLGTNEGGGGGIRTAYGASLSLNFVRVLNNLVTCVDGNIDRGGGIYLTTGATLSLTHSAIKENLACKGGGINANTSTVTISNSNIEDNTATILNGTGGGVYLANSGTITIERSTFDGNEADSGGGFYNNSSGDATITDSSFSHNDAVEGGGLYLYGSSSLTNVTINNNTADTGGGGIAVEGTVNLENVTIAGNTAAYGGGIRLMANPSSILDMDHVSFAANTATTSGYAIAASNATTVMVTNTILASPSGTQTCYIDLSASWTSGGFNISNDGSCKLTTPGDWANTNPLLGMLGDYGGLTQTLPLLTGSPAINLGDPGDASDRLDQRGIAIIGGRSDIGAFEYYPPLIWLPLTIK